MQAGIVGEAAWRWCAGGMRKDREGFVSCSEYHPQLVVLPQQVV